MRKRSSNNLLLLIGLLIIIVVIYVIYIKSNNNINEHFSDLEQYNSNAKCKDCKVDVDMSSLS